MSDCVVRMEMPKGCADCGLLNMDEYDSFYKCPLNSYLVWYDKDDIPNYRMNGCPIICQLPEGHGRLIDASYVIDVMQDELDNDVPITVDDCFQIGCKIPTIVPAEAERSET